MNPNDVKRYLETLDCIESSSGAASFICGHIKERINSLQDICFTVKIEKFCLKSVKATLEPLGVILTKVPEEVDVYAVKSRN